LGIPHEVTWGGEATRDSDGKLVKGEDGFYQYEQKSHVGGPFKFGEDAPLLEELMERDIVTSQKHWDNWVKVRDFLLELESKGNLSKTETYYIAEARELIQKGHEVWMKDYGWINDAEVLE
jgi:hypothetical protein